jgi:hypothetical protein
MGGPNAMQLSEKPRMMPGLQCCGVALGRRLLQRRRRNQNRKIDGIDQDDMANTLRGMGLRVWRGADFIV